MFSVIDLDLPQLVWRWVTLWWGPGNSCQWNWGPELWVPSLMVSQYLVSLFERTSTLYRQVESWIKFRKKISKFSIVFWFTFNVYINYVPFGFNIKIVFMFVSEDCLMYLWEQCLISGIQRPLEEINKMTQSIYIPKGVNTPALDRVKTWEFEPFGNVRVRLKNINIFSHNFLY